MKNWKILEYNKNKKIATTIKVKIRKEIRLQVNIMKNIVH